MSKSWLTEGLRLGRLLLRNASLIVYSTKHKTGMQMVAGDVREASRIANVKIYVEQGIG